MPAEFEATAEDAGYACIWTAEAYGSDSISTAAWMLAQTTRIKVGTGILQMPARTPALAAMTAMTLHDLSGGRFILGVGPSGPQVIEGWHGEAYGRPLTRTREYIEIIRKIEAREGPLTHDGFHYQIPKTGDGTTGLGKPLKGILHSPNPIKIVTGTIAPAGVRVSGQSGRACLERSCLARPEACCSACLRAERRGIGARRVHLAKTSSSLHRAWVHPWFQQLHTPLVVTKGAV